MPLEVVGFIDDEHVEAGRGGLRGAVGMLGEKFCGAEDELAVVEGIALGLELLDGLAAFLIEEGEEEVEAAEEFDEPLVDEGFGDEDEDAVGASGEVEAVEDKAGFDGFAEANLVGEEEAGGEAGGGLRGDGELVGDEIDAGPDETAGFGAAKFGALAEGADAEVEVAELIGLAGEESVLGFEEGEGVEELLLGDVGVAAVIDDHVVLFGDLIDPEFGGFLIGDLVAGFEADADEGGGREGVLAHLFGGGEADFDAVAIDGDDHAQSEFRLGAADPSLAWNGALKWGIRQNSGGPG